MNILAVRHDNQWKAATIVGYGRNGALVHARLNEPYVSITTTGASFSPLIELAAGSQATVRWMNLDTAQSLGTGTNPAFTFGSSATRHVGFRVEYQGREAFDAVLTLNLGFDYTQDAGTYNIGAGYNYASQQISGVSGLQKLVNLRRFLAAGTNLTGNLDVSGLSHLEFIECFNARVQSINLAGCSSLVRLCLEANSLSSLDLNPVRHSLYDVRAAIQSTGTLTFVSLSGPMDRLYHYCMRDQVVTNMIPHTYLPVIQEHWIWNTGQTYADTPTSTVLRSFAAQGNSYDQASVDRILTGLNTLQPGDGSWHGVDLTGSATPSAAGQQAAADLRSRNWTVTVS